MNIFKNLGRSLLGLPSVSQEPLSINYLTLSFTGDLSQYEKEFQEDYFIRSLNPFRFSLILSMIFYGAFAFLDAVTVPELKEVFWFIRFGIVFPVLIAVFIFSYFKTFKKYMQFVISFIMFFTGFGIIIMIILCCKSRELFILCRTDPDLHFWLYIYQGKIHLCFNCRMVNCYFIRNFRHLDIRYSL